MKAYDGRENYSLNPGDYCIARKNHLARYIKYKNEKAVFEKVVITFDEPFLRSFLEKHPMSIDVFGSDNSFLFVQGDELIKNFIQSLDPYYNGNDQIDRTFADVKREELLLILLKNDPAFANVFFNFGIPEKINLEEFMNRNFRFNISMERLRSSQAEAYQHLREIFERYLETIPQVGLKRNA